MNFPCRMCPLHTPCAMRELALWAGAASYKRLTASATNFEPTGTAKVTSKQNGVGRSRDGNRAAPPWVHRTKTAFHTERSSTLQPTDRDLTETCRHSNTAFPCSQSAAVPAEVSHRRRCGSGIGSTANHLLLSRQATSDCINSKLLARRNLAKRTQLGLCARKPGQSAGISARQRLQDYP